MNDTLLVNGIQIPVVTSLDIEKINDIIKPEMIENYVSNKPNWKMFGANTRGVKFYQYKDGEDFIQIDIPFNANFIDYKTALYNCIVGIAKVEHSDAIDVCARIIKENRHTN